MEISKIILYSEFNCTNTKQHEILDMEEIEITIECPVCGYVLDMDVLLTLNHTNPRDLTIDLERTSDTRQRARRVNLKRWNDDTCGNFDEVIFDDQADFEFADQCDDVLTGRFKPRNELSGFLNEYTCNSDETSEWLMKIHDRIPGDRGDQFLVQLMITYSDELLTTTTPEPTTTPDDSTTTPDEATPTLTATSDASTTSFY